MICVSSVPRRKQPRSQWAFTLIEMLVGTGVGSLVLLVAAQITMYTARSFVAMGNYNDLDRCSRNALDLMSRDIRGAKSVGSYATNQLVLTNMDGAIFSYTWDPNTGNVTRQWGTEGKVLLSGCDYFCFRIWQRNPTVNFWFTNSCVAQPYVTKLVDVSWRCSRQIMQAKVNTESVQTAKICIRN